MPVNPPRAGAVLRERAPTIHDIARAAAVSKTTVSRVLNDSARVAPETRTRVLEVIDGLGFQVNHAARSLRTSRTGLVGILVPVISIFGLIVESLDADLAEDGVSILLTSSRRHHPDRDVDAIETLVARGVDALVLAPSDDRSASLARLLRGIRQPLVLLDRELRGVEADSLLVDQGPGMHGAVEHLAGVGRRRIGLLTRDRKTRPGREIIARYREAVARLGLDDEPALVAEFADLDRDAGRDGVDRLLAAGADAVIATGTMVLTASILERLGDLGVRTPGDVSLVVWGEHGIDAYAHATLPRIAYPVDEIARRTASLLLARLAGSSAPPRVELCATAFVPGASPPPA